MTPAETLRARRREHWAWPDDLTPSDAVGVLDRALTRGEYRVGSAWYGAAVEILYNGDWVHLARTDQKDDVCTGHIMTQSLEDEIKFYRDKARLGARVREGCFAVIDSYSDG